MFLKTRFSIIFVMAVGVFMLGYVALHAFLAAFTTGILGFLFFLPLSLGIAALALKLFKSMKVALTLR